MRSLSTRLLGPIPVKGAPEIDRFEWLRGVYLRMLPFNLVAFAVALLISGWPTIALLLVAACALIWLQGWISLTLRIRRLRRSDGA